MVLIHLARNPNENGSDLSFHNKREVNEGLAQLHHEKEL